MRPLFSVIIPTRNRSGPFFIALRSVLQQQCNNVEVIAVDDGSSGEHVKRYQECVEAASITARMLNLVRTPRGHGPSYARNFGAAHANGQYLCFLDDDDQWTDLDHLGRVAGVIATSTEPIDLILCNQRAFRNGVPVRGVTWIEDLKDRLREPADPAGAYVVTPAELLSCQAHCHLNTTIVSRSLFSSIEGFDDQLRYEEDRDFYLRAIDQAAAIRFLPDFVSRHNISDPKAEASASTEQSELSKRLQQLRVFDKAVLFSARPEVRRYAMRQRNYVLKHIATEAARRGRIDCAAYYGWEALMTSLTLGWLGTTARFTWRGLELVRRPH